MNRYAEPNPGPSTSRIKGGDESLSFPPELSTSSSPRSQLLLLVQFVQSQLDISLDMASKKNPMTQTAASRVQSTQAKAGGDTSKGSFPARAQASAAANSKAPSVGGGSPASPTAKSSPTPKSPTGGKPKKK
ncbi:hypothetical protein K435DRAFT_847196 [Dendrothele bispora CBS 962.96]|uniref:Uncharacterized protein n=1 Tax=Dendrothele bispora (strain CBS 962.96) TaxID=1314807 RepID=A0A4S8MZX0_DENBC|nr:hypothetical protein K435DRAFT_847196 [Dendrothele bispora CBS 962.96]